jgi:hypothetical protein
MSVDRMSTLEFRPATPDLVREYYGGPAPVTFKGYVAVLDDRPVGVGGVSFVNGVRVAFSEMKDEMRPHLKARARAVRVMERLLDSYSAPILAVANPDEPTSAGLLRKLGFKDLGVSTQRGPVLSRVSKCVI